MAKKFIQALKDGKPVLVWVPSKGDRIMFPFKGEMVHAFVTKVSLKSGKVTASNGEFEYIVSFAAVKPSDKPVEKDPPSPMDAYEVRKYKEVAGHDDSQPFQAEIWKNGKKILLASNDGWGGSNNYSPADYESTECRDALPQFHKAAEAWQLQFGIKKPFEPSDDWVAWYVYSRPVGITAAQYCKKYRDEMDKFMGAEAA